MKNRVETELKEIYDHWPRGLEFSSRGTYSRMFQVGVPDECLTERKPLIMYVGQECRDCDDYKSPDWCKAFLTIQMTQKTNPEYPGEKVVNYPFWRFARLLAEKVSGNVVWNNLDKFHRAAEKQPDQPIDREEAAWLNAAYGEDHLSVMQREILCIHPDLILFCVGPREKYCVSMAAAFDCDWKELRRFRPTKQSPVKRIDQVLGLKVITLWTYHPGYIYRAGITEQIIQQIVSDIELAPRKATPACNLRPLR